MLHGSGKIAILAVIFFLLPNLSLGQQSNIDPRKLKEAVNRYDDFLTEKAEKKNEKEKEKEFVVIAIDEEGRPVATGRGKTKEEALASVKSYIGETAKFFVVIDSVAAAARVINEFKETGRPILQIIKEVVPKTFTVEVLKASKSVVGFTLRSLFSRGLCVAGFCGITGPEKELNKDLRDAERIRAEKNNQRLREAGYEERIIIDVPITRGGGTWRTRNKVYKRYSDEELRQFLEENGIDPNDKNYVLRINPKLADGEFNLESEPL